MIGDSVADLAMGRARAPAASIGVLTGVGDAAHLARWPTSSSPSIADLAGVGVSPNPTADSTAAVPLVPMGYRGGLRSPPTVW